MGDFIHCQVFGQDISFHCQSLVLKGLECLLSIDVFCWLDDFFAEKQITVANMIRLNYLSSF
jgi:hypothetical protein